MQGLETWLSYVWWGKMIYLQQLFLYVDDGWILAHPNHVVILCSVNTIAGLAQGWLSTFLHEGSRKAAAYWFLPAFLQRPLLLGGSTTWAQLTLMKNSMLLFWRAPFHLWLGWCWMSGPLKEDVFQKEDQTRFLSYPCWKIYESCMLLTSIHLHRNEQWDKAPNYFSSHPLQLALLSMDSWLKWVYFIGKLHVALRCLQ